MPYDSPTLKSGTFRDGAEQPVTGGMMTGFKESVAIWKEEWGDDWPKRVLQEIADEYLLFALLEGKADPDITEMYRWLEQMIMAGVAATTARPGKVYQR